VVAAAAEEAAGRVSAFVVLAADFCCGFDLDFFDDFFLAATVDAGAAESPESAAAAAAASAAAASLRSRAFLDGMLADGGP
jgi:hypothetical protein